MKAYFKEFFAYNTHFNQQLADIFLANPSLADGRSHQLFSHILDAHHIWNHRILNQPGQFGVWESQLPASMSYLNEENHRDTLHILEQTDLGDSVSYKNSRGQVFQNSVGDILFHLVNHSTYHRGQIASDFREVGLEPLISDYIFWKR